MLLFPKDLSCTQVVTPVNAMRCELTYSIICTPRDPPFRNLQETLSSKLQTVRPSARCSHNQLSTTRSENYVNDSSFNDFSFLVTCLTTSVPLFAGAYFILSLMDKFYSKNMSLDAALELVDKCILEIKTRLMGAPPNFVIKIVDENGAREFAWRKSVEDNTGPPSSAPAPLTPVEVSSQA